MIIAMGFAMFRVAVQYLPIFPKDDLAIESASEAQTVLPLNTPVLEHAGD